MELVALTEIVEIRYFYQFVHSQQLRYLVDHVVRRDRKYFNLPERTTITTSSPQ